MEKCVKPRNYNGFRGWGLVQFRGSSWISVFIICWFVHQHSWKPTMILPLKCIKILSKILWFLTESTKFPLNLLEIQHFAHFAKFSHFALSWIHWSDNDITFWQGKLVVFLEQTSRWTPEWRCFNHNRKMRRVYVHTISNPIHPTFQKYKFQLKKKNTLRFAITLSPKFWNRNSA